MARPRHALGAICCNYIGNVLSCTPQSKKNITGGSPLQDCLSVVIQMILELSSPDRSISREESSIPGLAKCLVGTKSKHQQRRNVQQDQPFKLEDPKPTIHDGLMQAMAEACAVLEHHLTLCGPTSICIPHEHKHRCILYRVSFLQSMRFVFCNVQAACHLIQRRKACILFDMCFLPPTYSHYRVPTSDGASVLVLSMLLITESE